MISVSLLFDGIFNKQNISMYFSESEHCFLHLQKHVDDYIEYSFVCRLWPQSKQLPNMRI